METLNQKIYPEYSVAIRTLGLNPEMLRRELESIYGQSIAPVKVVVYIAEGYSLPPFRVGNEEYVASRKGMVAQRAMDYKEITTPLILMLDDDVILGRDSAEKLIKSLCEHELDCIAADTFSNHRLPLKAKLFAALTNLTFPHNGQKYAFRVRSNGSFSYLSKPKKDIYLSQSAAGPCSLWRKQSLITTAFAEELWMDNLGFAYNDDGMEFYKLFCNGGKLGVHYSSGVSNEDCRTMSDSYRSDPLRFALRAKAIYLCWHRSLYLPSASHLQRAQRLLSFWIKAMWLVPVHILAGLVMKSSSPVRHYVKGLREGIDYTRTNEYKNLPPYKKQ